MSSTILSLPSGGDGLKNRSSALMISKLLLIAFHLLSVTTDHYDADDGDDALCLHRRYLRHHRHCRHTDMKKCPSIKQRHKHVEIVPTKMKFFAKN